jgi:hypothetical protein
MRSSLVVPMEPDSYLDGDKPHSEDKPLRSAVFFRARRALSPCRRSRQVTNGVLARFRDYRPKGELGGVLVSPPNRVSPHTALSVRSVGIAVMGCSPQTGKF